MKSDIAKKLRNLEKYGYSVIAFGDKRPGRKAAKDWVDVVIFNRKYLCFVEVKTSSTKDKFSEGQLETAVKLSSIATVNKTVRYNVLKDIKQTDNFIKNLLGNSL